MDEVVFARHGESEASEQGVVGGDTPLTERGRAQARELGAGLAGIPVDICLTSVARRARETAAIALAGRGVPFETKPELGDIRFGAFERCPLDDYRSWVETHPPTAKVPGGESRLDTLRRFAKAFRDVAARPEPRILVVAHGLTLRALVDDPPRPVVSGAAYGAAVTLNRDELDAAVRRLERWCESPTW